MNGIYKNSPFFVGLDNQLQQFENLSVQKNNYPPYDLVELSEGRYEIRYALSGFKKEDIVVETDRRVLTIEGNKAEEETEDLERYHHKGISRKSFTRKFQLGEHIYIKGVDLSDGILTIKLEREIPKDQQPIRWEVKG